MERMYIWNYRFVILVVIEIVVMNSKPVFNFLFTFLIDKKLLNNSIYLTHNLIIILHCGFYYFILF